MGQLKSYIQYNMKLLAVLVALVIAVVSAEPEADAYYGYGYGRGYGYCGYGYGRGLVLQAGPVPRQVALQERALLQVLRRNCRRPLPPLCLCAGESCLPSRQC